MENPITDQSKEQKKVTVERKGKYVWYSIPLSGLREAKIVLPKDYTPEEVKTFKQAIAPTLDSIEDKNIESNCDGPTIPITMFLKGINVEHFDDIKEIERTTYAVKTSEDRKAYIAIPDCLKLEEINRVESALDDIGQNNTKAE